MLVALGAVNHRLDVSVLEDDGGSLCGASCQLNEVHDFIKPGNMPLLTPAPSQLGKHKVALSFGRRVWYVEGDKRLDLVGALLGQAHQRLQRFRQQQPNISPVVETSEVDAWEAHTFSLEFFGDNNVVVES